MLVGNAFLKHQ